MIDKRKVKERMKVQRNYVATLAGSYRKALNVENAYIKCEGGENQTMSRLRHNTDDRFIAYSTAKAVLLSCQSIIEELMFTVNIYRKGCDSFVGKDS